MLPAPSAISSTRKRTKDHEQKLDKAPKVSWVTTPPLKHIRGSFPRADLMDPATSAKQSRLSDSSPNSFVNEQTPLLLVFKKAKFASEVLPTASSSTIAASQESRKNFMEILNSIKMPAADPEQEWGLGKKTVLNPVNSNAHHSSTIRGYQPQLLKDHEIGQKIMKVSSRASSPSFPEASPIPASSRDLGASRRDLRRPALEKNYIRLLIVEVIPYDATNILLKVLDETRNQLVRINLDGSVWSDTEFTAGVRINLVFPSKDRKESFGKSSSSEHYHLARDEMLIVDPDELVSITTVADSFHCMRRSIIKDRIRIRGGQDQAIVHGNIIHELFQAAVVAGNFDKTWLSSQLSKSISDNVEDLYAIGQSEEECFNLVSPFMDNIVAWRDQNYLSSASKSSGIKMLKALDVEERVWSPMYGLKGNIDVTAKVKIPGTSKLRYIDDCFLFFAMRDFLNL